tara:strand:+ start:410 stop:658 length:249 start_codon:yes stop_codon:yes gene_type:complete
MAFPKILEIAYDLKHQLDNLSDKSNTYVDGVETEYSSYERIEMIISFLEYCNYYPASCIHTFDEDDAEKAGKEAYGNVTIEK